MSTRVRGDEVRVVGWRGAMLLALALGSVAAPLSAQLSELTVGARVRVRAPEVVAGRLTGVIIARGADTLTVTRASATPLILRVSQLSTVEISRGRSHGRGAARGALWGGGVMAVLGVAVEPARAGGLRVALAWGW